MMFSKGQISLILLTTGIIVFAPLIYMLSAPLGSGAAGSSTTLLSIFSSRQLSLAISSFTLAGGATIGSLAIGIPFALLLARTDLPAQIFFFILGMIPLLIPPYIHAIAWNHFFSKLVTLPSIDLHTVAGAIFILSTAYFPIITFLLVSGLKSIDKKLEEAALLTQGKMSVLTNITLPLVRPNLISGGILVFIFSLVDFGVADMLRVKVYPIEIFIQFSAFYDDQGAMMLTIPLLCITGLFMMYQKWTMKKRQYITLSSASAPALNFQLGVMRMPCLVFCMLIISFSVVLPCISLIIMAGAIGNYQEVLASSYEQIAYSIFLAVGGGVACMTLSIMLSLLFSFSTRKSIKSIEYLSYTPLAMPSVALGIGLVHLWNRPGLDFVYGSSLIIIIGYVAHFLPFSLMSTSAGVNQLDPKLLDAARLVSDKSARLLGKIILPLISPSLLTGFFLVFFLSLGDLGTTLLLIPPGRETLPIKIYNLMHYGADNMVAALSLILILVLVSCCTLFIMIYRFLSRKVSQ